MRTSYRATLVGALLSAVALMGAAPAAADDESYLDTLEIVGVPVDDPAAAIAMGRNACALLDQGVDVATVASRLMTDNALSADQAGFTVGVAVAAYCDQHRGLVDR